jgi:hypothetical protein
MSGILGRDSNPRRQESRPDLLEANQANPNHPDAANDLRSKWGWQECGQNAGLNAVVDQDSPIDNATNDRELHRGRQICNAQQARIVLTG